MSSRMRLLGLTLAATPLTAIAVTPPLNQPNAGSLLNQQEQQQRQIPQQLPAPEAKPERPALKPGGAAVVVKRIRFSGATDLVPPAKLERVVAYAVGKKLDFAGLETLARKVTDYLHAQGWFLANAYLPQQDVTQGHIEIVIRAGHLDGAHGKGTPFSIEKSGQGTLRIHRSRLAAIAAPLLPAGAVAKKGDLERALLLVNDLPGISARARLQKGQSPDSTHVAIAVAEGPLLTATAWADNYGNYSTGSAEANIAAQLNDPAHIGDQLTAGATHSQGMDLGRLGYSAPLTHNGLRLGLSASTMQYRVVNGLGKDSGFKGESTTWGAKLSYPIIRRRRLNLSASGGYHHKRLKDKSAAGTLDDKRVDVWDAALSGNALDSLAGGGLTHWGLTLNAGHLDLSHNAQSAQSDAAGYRTAGDYTTLDYSLSRLQKLPGAFTLYGSVSGQSATKNLDSSAQFILGGPYGIRAYPVGEGSGDAGWLTNLELRYDLPGRTPLGQWRLVTFYDAGQITLHHDTRNLPISTASHKNTYGLAGWGVGISLRQGQRYRVQLSWAGTLGSNPGRSVQGKNVDNHADNSRLWLQALVRF